MTVHRPPCPSCEGAGYHSKYLGSGVDTRTKQRIKFHQRRRCDICGGQGRVHPDTLESYLRNVVIEEDGQ